MVEQTQQVTGSSSNEQIKTLGYSFDKTNEINIEILLEQAKIILNRILLSQSRANAISNPLLSSYIYEPSQKDNIVDARPAAEYLLRASSLLENLLLKASDFKEREEWIKKNKEYQKDIYDHLQNASEIDGIHGQIKELALNMAKKLGMTDTSIKKKRWEYFL
jgi:hypothetical protein